MNYPNKKENKSANYIEYGKRGMTLESDINSSNKYYLENDIAVIYKKPTPIKVVKVNYNKRINTKIVEVHKHISLRPKNTVKRVRKFLNISIT